MIPGFILVKSDEALVVDVAICFENTSSTLKDMELFKKEKYFPITDAVEDVVTISSERRHRPPLLPRLAQLCSPTDRPPFHIIPSTQQHWLSSSG